jgi:hypothetical protein
VFDALSGNEHRVIRLGVVNPIELEIAWKGWAAPVRFSLGTEEIARLDRPWVLNQTRRICRDLPDGSILEITLLNTWVLAGGPELWPSRCHVISITLNGGRVAELRQWNSWLTVILGTAALLYQR